MNELTLLRPDDWHVHFRDGAALAAVAPDTARQFGRAIVMPNLKPPVTTTALALAYRDRILAALPEGSKAGSTAGSTFQPLMTLYLTDNTMPEEIVRAKASGAVVAVKYYPAGATTNSDSGVSDLAKTFPVLEAMQQAGMPLLIHGEVTDPSVDIFDREKVFIETVLIGLTQKFPRLKIVLEHITTSSAVQFVESASHSVAATITAHHLLLNRNAMFQGGIRPHHYCLPVIKRETHRQSLLAAAISGNPKFFLGTDSAPHARNTKEAACGCAGIYTARTAMELYAEAFDSVGALDKLEAFASHFGADFYGLPRNKDKIVLVRERQDVPATLEFPGDVLVPMRAGESVAWRMVKKD